MGTLRLSREQSQTCLNYAETEGQSPSYNLKNNKGDCHEPNGSRNDELFILHLSKIISKFVIAIARLQT